MAKDQDSESARVAVENSSFLTKDVVLWVSADQIELVTSFNEIQPSDLFGESDFPSVDPLKVLYEEEGLKVVALGKRPKDWRMFYDNSSARRKDQPVTEGFFKYCPAAIRLASEVSRLGNDKHNPGQPLHHARNKSGDHLDCAGRHLLDADSVDGDAGIIEAVNAFWRLGMYIQEKCEREYGWPKAPNAKGEAK